MTLRMGDGPVANLPTGLDAYAGYTDQGGDGITFPGVVAKYPNAHHLSISVHGQAPAMCGDVENGALTSWVGYAYGYAGAANVGNLIQRDGRPRKLWVAHYTSPHICTSQQCWPWSPVPWTADGTQWTTHGDVWDESLLADDFFAAAPIPPSPLPPPLPPPDPWPPSTPGRQEPPVIYRNSTTGTTICIDGSFRFHVIDGPNLNALVAAGAAIAQVSDAQFQVITQVPPP